MPIKWSPDNDQMLLLKILETHDIHLDTKKISAAWPQDKGEAPTARAITERLVKIRDNAKKNGAGHFGISSSQSKTSSGKAGIPRSTKTMSRQKDMIDHDDDSPSPSKRHRTDSVVVKSETIETDDERCDGALAAMPNTADREATLPAQLQTSFVSGNGPSSAYAIRGGSNINSPMRGLKNGAQESSPTKRKRTASVKATYAQYDGTTSDGDDGAESDASDFADEEAV